MSARRGQPPRTGLCRRTHQHLVTHMPRMKCTRVRQLAAPLHAALRSPYHAMAVSPGRPAAVHCVQLCPPRKLTADLIKSNGVTLVFTMGCGDKCPYGEARHVRVQALVARACGCRRKALGCRPGADGVGA